MEPFARVFFSIDHHGHDEFTIQQLEEYVKENHLDHSMVTRWSTLFDPENTGIIKFSKFCDVLGLKPEEARVMREAHQAATLKSLNPDVRIIAAEIPMPQQIEISEKAIQLSQPPDSFDETLVADELKKWLDTTYGRSWQIILVKGSHWMSYAYKPGSSFQFRLYNHSYLIWQSPYVDTLTPSNQN